jgi:hypothetical protein
MIAKAGKICRGNDRAAPPLPILNLQIPVPECVRICRQTLVSAKVVPAALVDAPGALETQPARIRLTLASIIGHGKA